MVVFPNCKINLGLQVLQKRSDGFHELATVFYPIPLKDILEIVPVQQAQTSLNSYGLAITGNAADNLCAKAWQLLKTDFPELPPVAIHLLKNIPMGAGLGGGSADAAFMLQMLNRKFHLDLTEEQLLAYALQLGSDCPFFIINKPCYATGRGEQLTPLTLSLKGYQLVLVTTGIHVNTGAAFTSLQLLAGAPARTSSLQTDILEPVTAWKNLLFNDFEKPVFQQHPQIKEAKENLYALGAVYASMSGSGSVVFGIFDRSINLTSGLPGNYAVMGL